MRYAGFLATLVAGVMIAGVGAAQTVRQAGPPQPAPPAGFEGSQYVDGRGCVYIRAGISGQTTWVPRVGPDRTPICGDAPAAIRPPVVAQAPAQEAAPAPQQAAAAPRVIAPPAPSAPQPRVVATAPPERRSLVVPRPDLPAQPAAVRAPQQAEPAPRLTLSQVCAGRSGPVEGFVVARTGAPVSCGAPARVASAPAVAAPVQPTPLRVTRTEICDRIARTGETFLERSTGRPVVCPGPAPAVTATATAAMPHRTITAPLPQVRHTVQAPAQGSSCPGISPEAEAFLREIGAPVDCGPWARSTVRADVPVSNVEAPAVRPGTLSTRGAVAPAALAPAATVPVSTLASPTPLFRQPVPASNPSGAAPARTIASPPAGYRSVWDDGRVNLSRGLARPYF
jgi:hypothetical protein